VRWGCVVLIPTLLGCTLSAVATSSRCTGANFPLSDPAARPNGYCKLTHFPGLPPDPQTTLILAAIFFTPALLVLAGAAVAVRQRNARPLAAAAVLALGWLVASFLSSLFANVGFAGHG
jgi:hypothetical protein